MVGSQVEIQSAPNLLAPGPPPCAMLRMRDGKHTEAEVRYKISAGRHLDVTAGRAMGCHAEFRRKPAEAVATARRLRREGYSNVRITDISKGEPCDEASLERAAWAEGR